MFLILTGKTGAEITVDVAKVEAFEPNAEGCTLQMTNGTIHVTIGYEDLNRILGARRVSDFPEFEERTKYFRGIDARELAAKYSAESVLTAEQASATPGLVLDIVPLIQVNARNAKDIDDMFRPRNFDPLKILNLSRHELDGTFTKSTFEYHGRLMYSDENAHEIQAKIDKVTK